MRLTPIFNTSNLKILVLHNKSPVQTNMNVSAYTPLEFGAGMIRLCHASLAEPELGLFI
jgi:hypothetical protein